VFGAPDALVAWGPPAGIAKAIIVDGGYRVTGKWRFASGSANATWMGGHSTVFETIKSFPCQSLALSAIVICQRVGADTSPARPLKNYTSLLVPCQFRCQFTARRCLTTRGANPPRPALEIERHCARARRRCA